MVDRELNNGKCLHCCKRKNVEARGLCRTCYNDDGIRSGYDRISNSKKGHGHEQNRDLRGWKPTKALPGTEEKIVVLEMRASRGWPLWHPLDAKEVLK